MEQTIITVELVDGIDIYEADNVYQYDRGDVLKLIGLTLPTGCQVHFGFSANGKSKPVLLSNGEAVIPQEFTNIGAPIYAWVYVSGEDYGATKKTIKIPVAHRGEITDEEPTPEQESTIDQYIALLQETTAEVEENYTELSGEVGDLKSAVEDVYDGKTITTTTINKLDPNAVTANKTINTTTGELADDTTCKATGIINVTGGATGVAFTGKNAAGTARVCLPMSRIVFYNSDNTVLSSQTSTQSNTVTTIPVGTAYLRIANQNTYFDSRQPMVEFVSTISEISASFIQYEETTVDIHGLIYLDETQQDILERVGDLETAVEALDDLPDEVTALEATVNDIIGADTVISSLVTFQRGSIDSGSGAYSNSDYYKYRVATPEKLTTTKDYIFTIASGFRLYLFYFDALGGKISAGWVQNEVEIASGSILRMIIARVTEDTSETADVETFCSKVTYRPVDSIKQMDALTEKVDNIDAVIRYGVTWDWWIGSNSIDSYGNSYIGYVDTDGYAGVMRRQPDGTMQYKRLEPLNNDDDHNACATIVLPDGRILAMGAYGHTTNNHIICYRSKSAYSIDEMERFSFDIPQTENYTYHCCYSQIFQYNGVLFDFLRCVCRLSGESDSGGWICLVSSDNGTTWTAYKAIVSSDPYVAFNYASDDAKILKAVLGHNPSATPDYLKGFTFDMSSQKFYDLSGTEIGHLVALNSGSIDDNDVAHYEDMTNIIMQGLATTKARLFTVAKAPKASTYFLYAVADDSTMKDFTYYLYNNGTSVAIGKSGVPFGNNHYISGISFGKDVNTLYYIKATTLLADGNHELHKVILSNGSIQSDQIIAESSICMIRPLFLGNGEIAVCVGHYNDQNPNGTYNSSFTAWAMNPLFVN